MQSRLRSLAGGALGALLGSAPLLLGGCFAEPNAGDTQSVAPYDDDMASVSVLSLGSRGPAVTELQQYLTGYGYFPNEALAKQFPEWVPVSAQAPEPGVYDEITQNAVRSLQARNGIEVTGVVDPATRTIMAMGRCGNPDSADVDPDSKFALRADHWKAGKRSFTWKVVDPSACVKWDPNAFNGSTGTFGNWVPCFDASHPAPATRQQLRDLANYAFTVWGLETDISFSERSSGTTDITFQFSEITQRTDMTSTARAIVAVPNALAVTVSTFTTTAKELVSAVVNYNQAQPLSPASVTPAGLFDMNAIVLHEVGHALSLDHSSTPVGTTPVMKPSIGAGPNELRLLSTDDGWAISARFDLWNSRPGLAKDLAIGANGSLWHIGTAATGDGFRIYKWNSFSRAWEEASGNGGAVRIAVASDGTPWVVTQNGSVWWHSANVSEGGWNNVQGFCAHDLSFGANGSLWFVTCTPDNDGPEGGFKVGKLIAIGLTADTAVLGIQEGVGPTHARRIAVAPEGTPWIVNTLNDVWFRQSQDPNVAGWGSRQGVKANDIAISSDYFAFVTGTGANAGNVYVRNDQPELSHFDDKGNKVIAAPARAEWFPMAKLPSGSGDSIAAGRRTLWATNTSLAVYEQTQKAFN
jgi:peptidoglycan hydrolase-like protein with peptidoglycan-binding domain